MKKFNAIVWIESAWDKVSSSTVVNCFTHAGHTTTIMESIETVVNPDALSEDEDDIPLSVLARARQAAADEAHKEDDDTSPTSSSNRYEKRICKHQH
jgi:hypothetical protein